MRRSALASISTSLLAASASLLAAPAALAGEPTPDPGRVVALEIEAALVRKGDVYLVLEPATGLLEIRARGIVLDSMRIRGMELVSQAGLLEPAVLPPLELPALWKVVQGPGDSDREVIAPDRLRPYTSEEEDEEEPEQPVATRRPYATPTPVPEPPVSYRARLDFGWDLWITDALPDQSWWSRFTAAVRDGWARLRGDGEDHPPAIAVALASEDARRLHHLMRTDTRLLVTAPSAS